MTTNATIYINGQLLCDTIYDGYIDDLGRKLSYVITNWRKILRVCKEHNIYTVNVNYWLKDAEYVYGNMPKVSQHDCKILLDPKVQMEIEEDNDIAYSKYGLDDIVSLGENELYGKIYSSDEDYQYNHVKGEVYVRKPKTNFPWIPLNNLLGRSNPDDFLYGIQFEMMGIIDHSEINSELYRKFRRNGPLASGRNYILACRKATECIPEDPNTWWNYGISLELANKFNDAIEAYKKAYSMTPNNPIICRILSKIYLKNKQIEESKQFIKRSIENLDLLKQNGV